MDEFLLDLTTTICAVSTPHGAGGIAVIRVSGPDAVGIVNKIWQGTDLTVVPSHSARLGQIIDERDGQPLDQCVATVFRAPRSYTGQDTVELSVHGSKWIQREVIDLLMRQGARLATRGEFTRRALANGRLDLAQAEGVADLIASESRAAHRIAIRQMKGSVTRALASLRQRLIHLASLIELELDFSEEDVEFVDRSQLSALTSEIITEVDRLHHSYARGQAIKEGIPVAIVGPTNAGKSSLLNVLLNDNRAIVSDIHGTTRDTIEETLEIGNYLFRFIDTAGLRATDDPIEQIGISRSRQAIQSATVIIAMLDATLIPTDPAAARDYIHTQLATILPPPLADNDNTDNTPADNDNTDNISFDNDNTDNTPFDNDNTDNIPADNDNTPYPSVSLCKNPLTTSHSVSLCKSPARNHLIIALNKTDLLPGTTHLVAPHVIPISTKTGQGIPTLIAQLQKAAIETDSDQILITSQRQAQALAAASAALHTLQDTLQTTLPTDLLAFHLRDAIHHLSTVTDPITTPDILTSIFQSFCIGK